ncbi:MAG: hypothetical protein WAT91_02385, partial [Saprospiraceae bacterium]
ENNITKGHHPHNGSTKMRQTDIAKMTSSNMIDAIRGISDDFRPFVLFDIDWRSYRALIRH